MGSWQINITEKQANLICLIPIVKNGDFLCIFLFTIIDGIFVGQGIGSDALGAVNIAMPMVMIATAINMLTSIGGCTMLSSVQMLIICRW